MLSSFLSLHGGQSHPWEREGYRGVVERPSQRTIRYLQGGVETTDHGKVDAPSPALLFTIRDHLERFIALCENHHDDCFFFFISLRVSPEHSHHVNHGSQGKHRMFDPRIRDEPESTKYYRGSERRCNVTEIFYSTIEEYNSVVAYRHVIDDFDH